MTRKEIEHNIKRLKLLAKKNLRVRRILDEMTDELAKVSLTIDDLAKDEVFQFSKHPEVTQKVTQLVNQYSNLLTKEITLGVNQAFSVSYAASTDILGKLSILSADAVERQRNTALQAFLKSRMQPDTGLSLSQNVWNYTNQHRAEFEMAMSDIIGQGLSKGMSAQELGRKIRHLLNDPDMMYRRYHEKVVNSAGVKEDKVFWRKRVIDEDGKVHFVKGDLEKVGQGVYRSARKNAERVTRTEINDAYRYADYERWNSEPFVIGFEIRLSGSHPQYDMCDELAGRYPKWFKFTSWHPQCLCIAVAILIPEDEMRKISTLPKEEYQNYKSPHLITDMPDNYKKYMKDNADRLERSTKKGTQPWWVRDNYVDGDFHKGFVNNQVQSVPKAGRPPKTPEQIADIQRRWNERKEKNEIIGRLIDPDIMYNDEVRKTYNLDDFTGLTDTEALQRLDRIFRIAGYSYTGGKTPSEWYKAHPRTTIGNMIQDNAKIIRLANQSAFNMQKEIADIGSSLLGQNLSPQAAHNKFSQMPIEYLRGIDVFINQFKSQIGSNDCYAIQTLSGIKNLFALHDANADPSKISIYMPVELLPKGKWLGDCDHVFSKVFFDKLGRYVPATVTNKKGSYFNETNGINLDTSDDRYITNKYRVSTVYHEYGHAIFAEHLKNDPTIKSFRRKWNGIFTKGDSAGHDWNSLENSMWRIWKDAKQQLGTTGEGFQAFSNDFFDALDTGQSVSGGSKMTQIDGHAKSYFGSAENRDTEIWAHICELNNGATDKFYKLLYGSEFTEELKAIYSVVFQ